MTAHTSKEFDQELRTLRERLATMGEKAAQQLALAMKALGDRDDGPGIADKHRERVFERFYRADPSRTREAGGTGLGLSIVKHLVESMDGEVGVDANQPQGSIFWLQLPRAANQVTA